MIDIENIKRLKNISVEDDYLFPTIADTMNACFGKSWKGCQKSFIVLNDGSEQVAWFPKIAKWRNNQFVPYDSKQGWLNIVSDDGTQIIEEHPNDPRPSIPECDTWPRYVFGRYEDNPYRNGRIHTGEKSGLRFLGLFQIDLTHSERGHHEYLRIADKVSLLHYYKAIF